MLQSALLGGVTFDSRPKVLQRLWMYVKSNNLNGSDPGVAHIVKCNAALQNVRGAGMAARRRHALHFLLHWRAFVGPCVKR